MRRNGDGPVVALDIDGTIGDYHGHFLRFAQEWYGRPMPKPEDINPGLPLHKFMRTSKATYRQCKLAYRQGGLKRSMPVYEGAHELTVAIRKAGAELWITTTRPYLRLDNIDPDTRHFLRRNGIQFDAVLYGEHKYRDLARNVGANRVALLADDLPEMIEQGMGRLLPCVLRDQPYNRHYTPSKYLAPDMFRGRVYDLEELKIVALSQIQKWRENNDHVKSV